MTPDPSDTTIETWHFYDNRHKHVLSWPGETAPLAWDDALAQGAVPWEHLSEQHPRVYFPDSLLSPILKAQIAAGLMSPTAGDYQDAARSLESPRSRGVGR